MHRIAPCLMSACLACTVAAERTRGSQPRLDDTSVDDGAVRAAVEAHYRAVDRKDLSWIDENAVPDAGAVAIATDPGDYWVGWKNARPGYEELLKTAERTATRVSDVRIQALGGGSVVVANYLLDADGSLRGAPFSVKEVRATMVLERHGGQWLLAAGHASLPAPRSAAGPRPIAASLPGSTPWAPGHTDRERPRPAGLIPAAD